MQKTIFLVLLLGFSLVFSATQLTDEIQLEWADNDFVAVDIAVGNLDNDAKPEAVVIGTAGANGEELGIVIFEIGANETIYETSYYLAPTAPTDMLHPESIVLCDVDGNGYKDIVVGGYGEIIPMMETGFVYTYEFDGAITPQYEYDMASFVEIYSVGAKQGANACNVHAVGVRDIPGAMREYTAVLNTDSGSFDMYHEDERPWLTDSIGYGIDFFADGTVVTTGSTVTGWLSTQHVFVTLNPGNDSGTFGSTTTSKQGKAVKVADVTGDGDEEIIVGVDYAFMSMDSAQLLLLDDQLTELDWHTVSNSTFYNDYILDVDACDLDGDGVNEVVALTEYPGTSHSVVEAYDATGFSLIQTFEYDSAGSVPGYDSTLVAITCTNTDLDSRAEVAGVFNLVDQNTNAERIMVAVLESEPIIPAIVVVSPSEAEALNGMMAAVIEVVDDSPQTDLIVQYRVISHNMTSYYQAMNPGNGTFYTLVNLSYYADGAYTIQFKSSDPEGNEAIEEIGFYVDTSILTVSLLHPSEGSVITPGTELVFSASNPLNSFVYSIDNGATNTSLSAPYVVDTTGWGDGPAHVLIWAESVTSQNFKQVFNLIVDASSPSIILVHPTDETVVSGEDVALRVTDYELAVLTVKLNSVEADYLGAPMPIIIDTTGWEVGTPYKLEVIARDIAGNPPSTETYLFTVVEEEAAPVEEPVVPGFPAEEPQLPPELLEATELIESVEVQILEAQSNGEDTELAEKILIEAKRLLELGQYAKAKQVAMDAQGKLGITVAPTTPLEPSTTPLEPPTAEQPAASTPTKPVERDYTWILIGGVAVLVVLGVIAYVLSFGKKSQEPERALPPKGKYRHKKHRKKK